MNKFLFIRIIDYEKGTYSLKTTLPRYLMVKNM